MVQLVCRRVEYEGFFWREGAYGRGVGGGKSPMLARAFLVVVEVVVKVFLGGLEVALEEIVVLVLWSLVVWKWIWEVVMWVKDEVLICVVELAKLLVWVLEEEERLVWVMEKLVEGIVAGSLRKTESPG